MDKNNLDEQFRQSRNRFLQMMLFDLRTSAVTIDGFSKLLAEGIDGTLNPKQTSHVNIIRRSGLNISFMLDLFTYVLGFDDERWNPEEESLNVNLKQLVDEALDISGSFGSLRIESHIELANEISQNLPSFKASYGLTTIIKLMIMTAFHASMPCEKIVIKAEIIDKWIDLYVLSNPSDSFSKFDELQPKYQFRNIYDAIDLETKEFQKEILKEGSTVHPVLLAVVHGLSSIHQAELRMKLSKLSSDIILRIPRNAG